MHDGSGWLGGSPTNCISRVRFPSRAFFSLVSDSRKNLAVVAGLL